jgi:predicted enzyme related to lactoylglutathione lyase
MTYTLFKQDGKDVGGMLQMTAEWAGVKPHWMAYVAVEDVDACAKKIPELGGKVCVPPTDISVGRFAVVEDPAGAVFSIITLKG